MLELETPFKITQKTIYHSRIYFQQKETWKLIGNIGYVAWKGLKNPDLEQNHHVGWKFGELESFPTFCFYCLVHQK